MRRRDFLGLCAAAAATPLVPKALAAALPVALVLYGDGIHDDTAALQAWGAGRPVRWADGRELGHILENGRFLVRETIKVTRQDGCMILNNFFDCRLLPATVQFVNGLDC